MADISKLNEKEQRELYLLLRDQQANTLILRHSVPRPPYLQRADYPDANGVYTLVIHKASLK